MLRTTLLTSLEAKVPAEEGMDATSCQSENSFSSALSSVSGVPLAQVGRP